MERLIDIQIGRYDINTLFKEFIVKTIVTKARAT